MNEMKGEEGKSMRNKMKFKEKRSLKELKNSAKGITLIALVITIIVLLILAAVSIATLTGQNGILNQANKAKNDTGREAAKEKVEVKVLGSYGTDGNLDNGLLEDNLNKIEGIQGVPSPITDASFPLTVTVDGYEVTIEKNGNVTVGDKNNNPPQTGTTLNEAKDDSMLTKDTDTDVKVADGTVTIPAKFQVAEDSGNTIDEGIVIEDKDSNQFVWVPVSKENFDTEFVREHFGTEEQKWWTGTFVTNEASANNMYEPTADEEANSSEVEKMYRSVKYNEGFYVGRYEAGTTNKREEGAGIEDSVVVKKGANVYNYIKWGNRMDDETGGAVQLARSFAGENGYKTVTSTLCYGVQWDAIMRWMKDVPNLTEGKYVEDSTGMGWYSDNYSNDSTGNPDHKTGIDLDGGKNEVKKIYDLAGNVYEWTMESYGTYDRVLRGGDYSLSGSGYPASRRSYGGPSIDNLDYLGFRVTLYLNS